jgi:hypothetical protein
MVLFAGRCLRPDFDGPPSLEPFREVAEGHGLLCRRLDVVLDSRAGVALRQAHVALGTALVRGAEHAATVVRRYRAVSLCHVTVPVGDSAWVYGNIGKRPLAPPWRNDRLHQMPDVIGPTRRFMLGGGLTLQMGHIFGERRFDLDRVALAGADFTCRDPAAFDSRGVASFVCRHGRKEA